MQKKNGLLNSVPSINLQLSVFCFSVVDVGKVTDTILSQRGIGSVIKQSLPDDIDDADGSEDPNEVKIVLNVVWLHYWYKLTDFH